MFLIERLFGVGIFSVALIVACLLITDKKVKYKRVLFVYLCLLAIGGWFYVPDSSADLYRINELFLSGFKHYSFADITKKYVLNGDMRFDYIYYWVFSKIGIPKLLPTVNATIVYFCIFYVLTKSSKIYKATRKTIATTLLFVMSSGSYIYVISGIRSMLGCSLLALLFFRENVERKFNVLDLVLYVIAAFLHDFVFILVGVRFVVQLFDKVWSQRRRFLYACLLFATFFVGVVMLSDKLDNLLSHVKAYLSKTVFFYIWDYIIGALCLLVGVSISLRWNVVEKRTKKKLHSTFVYLLFCIAIAVVFGFEFSIFHRTTTYFLPIILIPIMINVLQPKQNRLLNQKTAVLRSQVTWLSLIILFLSCFRGSLCGIKFFVL